MIIDINEAGREIWETTVHYLDESNGLALPNRGCEAEATFRLQSVCWATTRLEGTLSNIAPGFKEATLFTWDIKHLKLEDKLWETVIYGNQIIIPYATKSKEYLGAYDMVRDLDELMTAYRFALL